MIDLAEETPDYEDTDAVEAPLYAASGVAAPVLDQDV